MNRRPSIASGPNPRRATRSWREKLADSKGLPKVVTLATGATLAIPAPAEVDQLIRNIPRGSLASISVLRAALASRHHSDSACQMTIGIFAWIAARAADEAASEGSADITPYWRLLKDKGELNPKYPGGIAALTARLNDEGHSVHQRGKRFFVSNYEPALIAPHILSRP
jgi:hypothetical protein